MQGVEAFHADFRGADLRQVNFGGAYLEGAVMPPPQRQPSPSEIARNKQPRAAEKEHVKERQHGR